MNRPKDYADRSGLLRSAPSDESEKRLTKVEVIWVVALIGAACFWIGFWVAS